jgi:hypothetical protein
MQSRDAEIYDQFSTNVIQVYDHDVDTLKFDLTEKESKTLVGSGREATIEWLQSHFSEAYAIKVYNSEEEWLAAKTIEEVKKIKNAYVKMLNDISSQPLEKLTLPDDDTRLAKLKELEKKIAWLNDYLLYRLELGPNKNTQLNFTPHIDLIAKKPRAVSDVDIQKEMENSLDIIKKQLELLELKIEKHIKTIDPNQHRLYNTMAFDEITYLARLEEKYKMLKRMKIDLCNKMKREYKSGFGLDEESAQAYTNFHGALKTAIKSKQSKMQHAKLVELITNQLTKRSATFQTEDGALINLDLKNIDELKIYIMASYLYLKYIIGQLKYIHAGGELLKELEEIYKTLFSGTEIPKNMLGLGQKLHVEKIPLLMSSYRIETIIKNFMQLDKPKENAAAIDIDYIFDVLSTSNFLKKQLSKRVTYKEEENDFEMDYMYDSFDYRQSEKFLLFQRIDSEIEDLQKQKKQENFVKANTDKIPRCLKRYEN